MYAEQNSAKNLIEYFECIYALFSLDFKIHVVQNETKQQQIQTNSSSSTEEQRSWLEKFVKSGLLVPVGTVLLV